MTRALLEQALEALQWEHGGEPLPTLTAAAINAIKAELDKPNTQPVQPECWCTRCDLEVNTFRSHMAICPLCGDKWCPRAKDHRNECTKKSTYDQTALELCETCGWKTLIPGEGCLNCERERLRGWLEGDANCPCCDTNDVCVDGCTFAEDCPEDNEKMLEIRKLLRHNA